MTQKASWLGLAVAGWMALCSMGISGCDPRQGPWPADPDVSGLEDTTEAITVYDIQDATREAHPGKGAAVCVDEVIVTTPMVLTSGQPGFWVMEPESGPYSGIFVFAPDLTETFQPGDVVSIRGTYDEYYENSQIVADRVTLDRQGETVTPIPVTSDEVATGGANAEAYEGCLVQIENAAVSTASLGFGNFGVKQAGSSAELTVQPRFSRLLDYTATAGDAFPSLVGVMEYAYNQFRLNPRSCTDLSSLASCTVCPDPVPAATIAMLQNPALSRPAPGQCAVVLSSVVVTSPVFKISNKDSFFVQDPAGGPWSGILVFMDSGSAGPLTPGVVVSLQGYSKEFSGKTEFIPSLVSIVSTTAPLSPTLVTPADIRTGSATAESYEGVLVRVEGVVVTDAKLPGTDYGYFKVGLTQTDPDAERLIIGRQMPYAYSCPPSASGCTDQRTKGDTLHLTGVLDYSYSQFRLEPRGDSDVQKL